MSATRIVKRYANRKLYDTERSCYVTLEDISVMIKEGADVKVMDNKSGEDLTTVTLAQIIFETEKKTSFMPLQLLRGLIQDSSSAISGYARQGVQDAQSSALTLASSVTNTVDQMVSAGDTNVANDERERAGLPELLGSAKQSFDKLQSFVGAKINGADGNTARNASLGRDMEEMRRRLAELEERLAHFSEQTV